jgi:hypothetical protein
MKRAAHERINDVAADFFSERTRRMFEQKKRSAKPISPRAA